MGHKRPRSCTPMNGLKNRGFHFEVALTIKGVSQTLNHLGSFDERFLELGIDNQIHVTHAVTGLGVGEGIKHVSIGILFRQGQWIEAF